MGIFGTKKEDEQKKDAAVEEKKDVKPAEKKASKKSDSVVSIAAAHGVIIAPIVTEKSHEQLSKNKYTFRVAKTATKKQVKDIVEKMYKVTVENVNIVVVKPKRRTVKYDRGYQSLYKKAIVTVKEGDHIAVFEGV